MCDARETGASVQNARKKRDFKDEAKQKQETKIFKVQSKSTIF
jgi:hypothetical protein